MSITSRPNVVLIIADNQQVATLACYGKPEIQTSRLDAPVGVLPGDLLPDWGADWHPVYHDDRNHAKD